MNTQLAGNGSNYSRIPRRAGAAWLCFSIREFLATQVAYFQGIEAAAPSFGVQLIRAEVHDAAEIESAINDFAQQPNGALIVAPNNATIAHRDLVIALAAQHRLPAVYP